MPAYNGPQPQLALTLVHTALDPSGRGIPTGVTSVQQTNLIMSALGHHADPAVAYVDPVFGHLCTQHWGRVLDGADPTLCCVLALTMLDVFPVADTILADHHFGDRGAGAREGLTAECSEDVLLADGIDAEGVRAKRVVQDDQWKMIGAEEV